MRCVIKERMTIFMTESTLQIAPIFGEHMVLQHGMPLKIWGNGPDGHTVTLKIQEQ